MNQIPARLSHLIHHRRLPLFWIVAVIGLLGPWLMPDTGTISKPLPDTTQAFRAQVTNIYDGDTMHVMHNGDKIKIRLYCIDAPEMDQGSWGRRSRDHLRKITGPQVRVVKHDTDRYGRTVAEVFSRGENLNLAMVREGWAAEYERYCDKEKYHQAEQVANQANRNIYREPGLQQTPWVYRKRH